MCQNVFSRSYLGGFLGGALCCSAALSSCPSSSSPTGVTAAEDVETGGRSSTDVEERVPVEVGASNWTKRRQRPPPPPPPPPPRPKSAARDGDLCVKNINSFSYSKHFFNFHFTFHWPAPFRALPSLLLLHRTSHLRSPSRLCLLLPPASSTMPSSCCSCTCSSLRAPTAWPPSWPSPGGSGGGQRPAPQSCRSSTERPGRCPAKTALRR